MNSWGFSGDGNYKKVTDRNDSNENISDIKDPLIKLSDRQGLKKILSQGTIRKYTTPKQMSQPKKRMNSRKQELQHRIR